MKTTSVTFSIPLGELTRNLRRLAHENNINEIIRIFPEIRYGASVSGSFEDLAEYYKSNPRRRTELLKQGKVKINLPFFDKAIPELKEILFALYSDNQEDTARVQALFKKLKGALGDIRRRIKISKYKSDNKFLSDDFIGAINSFNDSLPPLFEKWKWKIDDRLEWPFYTDSYVTILNIDALIDHAGMLANALKNRPKLGRPPEIFNMLLFHTVNKFTRYVRDQKTHQLITENGKVRLRKNWRLVFAALLWLHVNYDIPKMRKFIKNHENEETHIAFKKFVSWAKSEYSHFLKSGKGQAKWGAFFLRGSEHVGLIQTTISENSFKSRLL